MKKFNAMILRRLALIFSFLYLGAPLCFAQGWERVYHQFDSRDEAGAIRTLPLPNGNLLSLVSGNTGAADFHVLRLTATGEVLQQVTFDFLAAERAFDVVSTADGGFAVLYDHRLNTTKTHFILRLDAQLNLVWNQPLSLGDNLIFLQHLVETNAGFLAYGTRQIAPGTYQYMTVRTNAAGEVLQTHQWGTNFANTAGIERLSDGSFIAAGYNYTPFSQPVNARINLARFSPSGVFVSDAVVASGVETVVYDFTLTADGSPVAAGLRDDTLAYAVQLNAANAVVWEKTYPGYERLTAIGALADGSGFWATAWPNGGSSYGQVHLLRLDVQGNVLFTRTFGGSATPNYFTFDLQTSSDGGCRISGSQRIPLDLDQRLPWIIATDSQGAGFTAGVQGQIWYDKNADCVVNGDSVLWNWNVSVWQGQTLVANTLPGISLDYFVPLAPGNYRITVAPPSNGWVICNDTLDVVITANDTLRNQDFLVRFDPQPIDSLCGVLFRDFDGDCQKDLYEPGYAGWPIEFQFWSPLHNDTLVLTAVTDPGGHFCISDLQGLDNSYTGVVSGTLDLPGDGLNCRTTCADPFTVHFLQETGAFVPIGIVCDSVPPCPVLEVDVATDLLRPCQPSTYTLRYCNKGALTAEEAQVTLTVDPALSVTGASIPWESANGNAYTFALGDVGPEACGTILLYVETPCDEPAGITYCVEARAFPDTLCSLPGSLWDGSEIEVLAVCTGDSVVFYIRNVGNGNMSEPLDYIVIEDNVLLMQPPGTFQLNAGEEIEIRFPANGSFYRLEAEQAPGFPGLSLPVAWVEGCEPNGGAVSLGFVNQYFLPDNEPWLDIFCLESVNSYDPNDKNGFPRGYSDEHFIKAGTDLEYVIRFQNTGTAPAINVDIRDTLDVQYLDPTTVRPGASSHPYQFDLQDNGIVVFRFPSIYLPDTSAGEEASQGFVKFRVSQRPNLSAGTTIRNQAAIYFDNNAPVITNKTRHTIGSNFVLLETTSPSRPEISVRAVPNPTRGTTRLSVSGASPNALLRLRVWSAAGLPVLEDSFSGAQYDLDATLLPAGLYLFAIMQGGELLAQGKLVKSIP